MLYQFVELKARLRFVLFFTAAGLSTVSCNNADRAETESETFSVTFPIAKDTVFSREYVADIHAVQNVEIRSRVSGFIEGIHADEGQHVKVGQLLFSISSHEYKQELLKAKAALTSILAEARAAELEVHNVSNLFNKKLVSESELNLSQAKLEALQANVEEAKAQVSNSELQLSFAEIKAPFTGVLNRIPNKVGSLVEDGTLLTTLSDNREVFAYFNVSERDYLDIASNGNVENKKPVSLSLANGSAHKFKGVIETVEGEVDRSTGNIAFRARFPNPDGLVKHGSTGSVKLTTSIGQAILVPQKSTFEIQDNVYVYVVDDENKVHLRSFKPKLRLPHFYVVESGLSIRDKIVYEGIQRVKEGDQIQVSVIQMDNIISELAAL